MKHRVSKLKGALLDQAVAKAEGRLYDAAVDRHVRVDLSRPHEPAVYFSTCQAVVDGVMCIYSPSSNWAQGGPLIERERIGLEAAHSGWNAFFGPKETAGKNHYGPMRFGQTPLIAAMRAFVASRFGEEVELP